jgi:hypothetical protein
MIELEIDGVAVRVSRGADAAICGRDPCAEDLHVIGPTGAVRVMVPTRPVDFRKGTEGRSAPIARLSAP